MGVYLHYRDDCATNSENARERFVFFFSLRNQKKLLLNTHKPCLKPLANLKDDTSEVWSNKRSLTKENDAFPRHKIHASIRQETSKSLIQCQFENPVDTDQFFAIPVLTTSDKRMD